MVEGEGETGGVCFLSILIIFVGIIILCLIGISLIGTLGSDNAY